MIVGELQLHLVIKITILFSLVVLVFNQNSICKNMFIFYFIHVFILKHLLVVAEYYSDCDDVINRNVDEREPVNDNVTG